MIEKKKQSSSRMGAITFTSLWTIAYGLGWAALMLGGIFADRIFPDIFEWLPIWGLFALLGFVPGFISSVGQQWLIKRKMDIRIPFWWLWSTIAWTISGAALRLLEYWPSAWNFFYDERLAISMVFSALFVPPALVQAWLLRKHIKRAWMWPLAAIVSSSTFVLPILASNMINELEAIMTFGAAGLLQGAVMGLSLLWLFGMTTGEKTKKYYAEQEQKRADRILHQRLEDIENDVQAENIVDGDIIVWERSQSS